VLALMLIPRGSHSYASMLGQLGVLGGSLAWSVGTLYYRSIETRISPWYSWRCKCWLGGLMLLFAGLIHGDAAHFTPPYRVSSPWGT